MSKASREWKNEVEKVLLNKYGFIDKNYRKELTLKGYRRACRRDEREYKKFKKGIVDVYMPVHSPRSFWDDFGNYKLRKSYNYPIRRIEWFK